MVSHDYTQEVGLPSGNKTVSKPVAAIALALIAGGIWFVVQTYGVPAAHHSGHAEPPIVAAHK
jgi:hypothetical protein